MIKEKIKIAYIGLGGRGRGMLKNVFIHMPDVEIAVLCDIYPPALEKGRQILEDAGYPSAFLTADAKEAIDYPGIDAVVIMTGWREHAPLAEKAMLAGKYTAVEVGCAFDLEECYRLIDIYEKTGSPLMMLENCCYGRREMMALNLAKQGLYGDIVHCVGGYHHYLNHEDLFSHVIRGEPHYRLDSYIYRNCEQYPTHELGPIAKVLGINRGNRMLTLSSFASRSGGLKEGAKHLLGAESPYANMEYKQGDIITTIITCAGGQTIQLCLDTTAPRPYYSRNFTVRGTKGMSSEEGKVVFLEGMQEPVRDNEEEVYLQYDHPLHKEYHALGEKGGHGGMDWLVARAFVESVKKGIQTPIDAYDTALWMSIASLSEKSIAMGGAPVPVPDFTRGMWMTPKARGLGKYSLDEIVEDPDTPIFPE